MQPDALLHIWWLVAAMLVFMMQVGFLLLETGLIQERHMAGIAVKSMMMLLAASTAYTLVGFRYMWANSPFVHSGEWQFYQTGFAAVAATILSGALAGRTTLISNVIMATVVGGILFPLHGRWIWGDGWPWPHIHVHDFAGSGCVHLLGGLVALAGTMVAGPRREKKGMSADGPIHLPRRSLPLAACGVLFLWIGWMGFNGGSIPSADRLNTVGHLIISTCLAASAGGFAVCCVAGALRLLKPGSYVFAPYATLSGIMTGMVANSACCDLISDSAAKPLIVGAVAGIFAYFANWVLQRIYRIDDPIEAIAVHAGGGIVGLVFAGFYQSPTRIWPQLFDIAVLITIGFGLSWLFFSLIDLLGEVKIGTRIPIRLKSTAWEEEVGLIFDEPESRVGTPPIEFHYLPDDLKKGFTNSLALLIAQPVHIAQGLEESARALIDGLTSYFSKKQQTKTALMRLSELSDELAARIDSIPDLIRRLSVGQGDRVCLTDMIRKIIDAYTERYAGLVEFIFHQPRNPVYVHGDENLTPEAIRMLVSNGAKACIDRLEKQGIRIDDPGAQNENAGRYRPTVEITLDNPDGAPFALVNIKDNGIGIRPAVRHYLGQPFAGLNRTGEGSGLGLFFAAYITQAFGGGIEHWSSRDLTSPKESWTHFVMRLQVDEQENKDSAKSVSAGT